jgi:hypothetical protein
MAVGDRLPLEGLHQHQSTGKATWRTIRKSLTTAGSRSVRANMPGMRVEPRAAAIAMIRAMACMVLFRRGGYADVCSKHRYLKKFRLFSRLFGL